ncbi:MAG: PH domain-containing protein [Oscillospiraceae bacterium]|nr:PH domain-containing protein [Oscillospiraceae bacterium]
MNVTLTPQPRILTVWRASLVGAAFVPAFLSSLIFSPGEPGWWAASALWLTLFLLCYLWYLPSRFKRLSLAVEEDRFIQTGGVFLRISRTAPFGSVQFLRLSSSPIHRYFGLSSLIIVAPGGRILMPGLRAEEAERLVSVFFS